MEEKLKYAELLLGLNKFIAEGSSLHKRLIEICAEVLQPAEMATGKFLDICNELEMKGLLGPTNLEILKTIFVLHVPAYKFLIEKGKEINPELSDQIDPRFRRDYTYHELLLRLDKRTPKEKANYDRVMHIAAMYLQPTELTGNVLDVFANLYRKGELGPQNLSVLKTIFKDDDEAKRDIEKTERQLAVPRSDDEEYIPEQKKFKTDECQQSEERQISTNQQGRIGTINTEDLHDYGREETKMTKKDQFDDSGQNATMRHRTGNADEGVGKRNVLPDIKKIGEELPVDYSTEASQLIDPKDVEATDNVQQEVSGPGYMYLIHSLRSAMKLQNREQLSQIEKELCHQFKQHIFSVNRYLLYDTWVGYFANGVEAETEFRNVRIVALYDHQALPICSLPDKFICIPIYWREKDSVSAEAIQTSRQENIHINLQMNLSNETVKGLFKKHSNLTIVHPSSVKSKSFGTVNSHFMEKACIALYCHVKGIIPLGETEFDKKVDGVITDVREGFCRLNANEKLCPGTGITSSITGTFGTVGAFVEINSGRTAFLTAAHVVVPNSLWKTSDVERQQYVNSPWIPVSVCKNEKTDEQIGKVINWCFFEGAENQKCVDAALVEVDKQNISTENMFPQNDDADWKAAGYDSDELPKICASKLLKFTEINDKTTFDSSVLKYGLRTGITLGHFVYDGACIKVHNPNITYNEPVIMYGLVGVQGRFKQHFGQPGDSGALCCLVDKQDRTKIHPFGLVVAGYENIGISFVTHLEDVFQMLNLDLDQGIKFYPSSDPIQNQTYHGQSNSRANAPETSSHDSSSLEQTIKKIQNELVEQKKNTDKRFENVDSKLDLLLANFGLQTPRTPGKDEQQSHEKVEQGESL